MSCFRLVIRVGGARRLATNVPEEWSSSPGNGTDRTRLIGPLAQFFPMWQSVRKNKVARTVEMSAELEAAVERSGN